ncbi:MAG: ATP-binding cassette domain-containing protein [Rheinheimera sp.]|nr:ATP-binding cassette domain-containing protein [Rheinheimera sp.]
MRAMIQLQNISVQRGTKFLLDGADLTIYPGQKVGLIGANGTGKSTLFQLLLGKLAQRHRHTGYPQAVARRPYGAGGWPHQPQRTRLCARWR